MAFSAIFIAAETLNKVIDVWVNVLDKLLENSPSIVKTIRDKKFKVIDRGCYSIRKLNQPLEKK